MSSIDVYNSLHKIILSKDPLAKKEILIQVITEFNQYVEKAGPFIEETEYPKFRKKYSLVSAVRDVALSDLERDFPDLDLRDVPLVVKPQSESSLYFLVAVFGLVGWFCFLSLLLWNFFRYWNFFRKK